VKAVKLSIFFVSVTLLVYGCRNLQKEKSEVKEQGISFIKHAKTFDVEKFDDYIRLTLKKPHPEAKQPIVYHLVEKNYSGKELNNIIQIPIESIVVTSTTHIPMLEVLEREDILLGFQNTKYVSSSKTRQLIDSGVIKELGTESSLNTELLLDLNPDILVGFSMASTNKIYNTIEKAGIPVLINSDWLEETPLGRAEWIKFFGALMGVSKKADSIFRSIENNYFNAIKIAQKGEKAPTVLSGAIMSKDIWNLPAGDSFVARFLLDANSDYLWKDTQGKGSLSLSIENVLDKAKDAEYWIAPGYFTSKVQMSKNNKQYNNFKSFTSGNLYTPSIKVGATGGVLYYEIAPLRPDWVLQDLIKIFHPELLPNYHMKFFDKLPDF